ncbi:S-methyl-5-thioribose-1-phosphate isomerase [Solirubrobacter phytolaccae]|uniref:Methylthioribose-1-phosphate isomerase n=1 Tax=Solirubrobacter phytolaccae TaxID=1404360 RepID=A0A9X3S7N5_9ACTN|nr:S-methyl-5-thioribose-1-phosphate isomerase [Solirubrobacter phytolaccae]MDA0180528.1 S-methyl-5-thioribose-1-phosphate isomerase [Solirubrobacter phytolaccae]
MRTAVGWTGDAIEIIDQTLLPAEERVIRLTSVDEVVDAIQRLAVRGAPAIGVTGALGVLLAGDDAAAAERIASARPTAVNLRWAVERVLAAEDRKAEALAILEEDVAACHAIGEFGRAELGGAAKILTVCNTGRLATAGWGTALGVVYAKHAAGEPIEVFACETRPLLQGARLTAWELDDAGIPVTVLPDGAAPALLAGGQIDAVIVGADRIAANGDTANKIGTYALAIAARHHGVPFYVAAPRSTLDPATPHGAVIEIEERDGSEVRRVAGLEESTRVWNPAFDVTPASLITGLITDAGVLRAPFGPAISGALS